MTTTDSPLVSVGVRATGSLERLTVLLERVRVQTYPNLEILVFDDLIPGPAVIQYLRETSKVDPRVKFVLRPDRVDGAAELELLLRHAVGEFFTWACDGVIWDARFIERCLGEIGAQGSVMCGIAVEGRAYPLPDLASGQARVRGIRAFLRRPSEAIWLGVHRRVELQALLKLIVDEISVQSILLHRIWDGRFKTFAECLCTVTPDSAFDTVLPPSTDLLTRCLAEIRLAVAGRTSYQEGRSPWLRSLRVFLCERLRNSPRWGALSRLVSPTPPSDGAPNIRNPQSESTLDPDLSRQAYSQSGEDMIADFVFTAIGHRYPTYLDLGAHHPRRYSNTQYFYENGSRGVNVEADPGLIGLFQTERPLDINLNVGVGVDGADTLPFYVMSTPTLNTFDREEAERCVAMGTHRIMRVIDMPLRGVNEIIAQYFCGTAPDFLSVDVEGLDYEIITSIDLQRYRPIVICVETITFSENFDGRKIDSIGAYLEQKGYFLYADTSINSIFVDRSRWRRH